MIIIIKWWLLIIAVGCTALLARRITLQIDFINIEKE